MSGGSYNYIGDTLADECAGRMFDDDLNEMVEDFCKVLHDVEWWQSYDISEDKYRKTVAEFKDKWLKNNTTNGDMIKAMFPSIEVKEKNNGYEVYFGIGTATQFFNHQWWNAPYRA